MYPEKSGAPRCHPARYPQSRNLFLLRNTLSSSTSSSVPLSTSVSAAIFTNSGSMKFIAIILNSPCSPFGSCSCSMTSNEPMNIQAIIAKKDLQLLLTGHDQLSKTFPEKHSRVMVTLLLSFPLTSVDLNTILPTSPVFATCVPMSCWTGRSSIFTILILS